MVVISGFGGSSRSGRLLCRVIEFEVLVQNFGRTCFRIVNLCFRAQQTVAITKTVIKQTKAATSHIEGDLMTMR